MPINANWAALKAALGAGAPRRAPVHPAADPADAARARPERMGAAEGPTPVLAVDCEMVGLGPNGQRSSLARCVSSVAKDRHERHLGSLMGLVESTGCVGLGPGGKHRL